MSEKTIVASCLQSAFGFLPGLNVGPYGGRTICRDEPLAFVTATGQIAREHRLWRRHGLGAREVYELDDVYNGITSGRHADRIRKHIRRGHGRIQFFYVGNREEETLKALGLATAHTHNATAAVTETVGSKIVLHQTARDLDRPYLVVPSRVCVNAQDLIRAHHDLMRVNHTIKAPNCTVLKHAGWASGVGTAIADNVVQVATYAAENCDGKTPILIEAGFHGIRDVAVQATLTESGVMDVFVNEQVIMNGKDHAGNLVVSGDNVPTLSYYDKICLRRRAMILFRHWWLMGYRGEIGVDAIGIDGKGVDFGLQSDLSPIEIAAMQAGVMLDWRFVDPNPRTTASQYPQDVLEQLERRGGNWAVLMCNIWPAVGAVEDFGQLMRILRDLLPDGDDGALPLMTGLLPNKFAVMCMARETGQQNAAARVKSLLWEVRNRVGSAS